MKLLSEVAKDAMELPPAQQLTLARILLDLSQGVRDFSPDAEAAWEDELAARIEAVKTDAAHSRSYEEVFADLDRRYPA
jgi:hypothetical protein